MGDVVEVVLHRLVVRQVGAAADLGEARDPRLYVVPGVVLRRVLADQLRYLRPRPDEPHIVCLRVGGRLVGVELDEALDLLEIDPRAMLAADQIGGEGKLFCGVIEQNGTLIRLLDPEKLIAREESAALERAASSG